MGIEILLKKEVSVVSETLERMGIANKTTQTLFPSVYMSSKDAKYMIYHFKEMIALNGIAVELSDEDIQRRDSIIKLLIKWDMIEVVFIEELVEETSFIFVLPFRDKEDWTIEHKFRLKSKF